MPMSSDIIRSESHRVSLGDSRSQPKQPNAMDSSFDLAQGRLRNLISRDLRRWREWEANEFKGDNIG